MSLKNPNKVELDRQLAADVKDNAWRFRPFAHEGQDRYQPDVTAEYVYFDGDAPYHPDEHTVMVQLFEWQRNRFTRTGWSWDIESYQIVHYYYGWLGQWRARLHAYLLRRLLGVAERVPDDEPPIPSHLPDPTVSSAARALQHADRKDSSDLAAVVQDLAAALETALEEHHPAVKVLAMTLFRRVFHRMPLDDIPAYHAAVAMCQEWAKQQKEDQL